MSIDATTAVWERSRSKGAARLVLLAIAEHHNAATGRCHPGASRLAAYAGVPVRTVRRVLVELVALGELEIDTNAGPKGTNAYRLPLLSTPGDKPGDEGGDTTSPPVASRPGGVTPCPPRGDTTPPEPEGNRKEPPRGRGAIDEVLETVARAEMREAAKVSPILSPPAWLRAKVARLDEGEVGGRARRYLAQGLEPDEVGRRLLSPTYAREQAQAEHRAELEATWAAEAAAYDGPPAEEVRASIRATLGRVRHAGTSRLEEAPA